MNNPEMFKSSLLEGVNKSLPMLEEADVSVSLNKEKKHALLSIMNYFCEENSFKYNVKQMRKDFSKNFTKKTNDVFELNQDGCKICVETYDDNSITVQLVKGFHLEEALNASEIGEQIGLNYYKVLLFLKQYAE